MCILDAFSPVVWKKKCYGFGLVLSVVSPDDRQSSLIYQCRYNIDVWPSPNELLTYPICYCIITRVGEIQYKWSQQKMCNWQGNFSPCGRHANGSLCSEGNTNESWLYGGRTSRWQSSLSYNPPPCPRPVMLHVEDVQPLSSVRVESTVDL